MKKIVDKIMAVIDVAKKRIDEFMEDTQSVKEMMPMYFAVLASFVTVSAIVYAGVVYFFGVAWCPVFIIVAAVEAVIIFLFVWFLSKLIVIQ